MIFAIFPVALQLVAITGRGRSACVATVSIVTSLLNWPDFVQAMRVIRIQSDSYFPALGNREPVVR